jgi:hypothetical protein
LLCHVSTSLLTRRASLYPPAIHAHKSQSECPYSLSWWTLSWKEGPCSLWPWGGRARDASSGPPPPPLCQDKNSVTATLHAGVLCRTGLRRGRLPIYPVRLIHPSPQPIYLVRIIHHGSAIS